MEKIDILLKILDNASLKISECNLNKIKIKYDEFELELEKIPKETDKKLGTAAIPSDSPEVLDSLKMNPDATVPPHTSANGEPEIAGNIIKAPIVGVFYSSPEPGKPPFVNPGSRVNEGDVLFIIESMKLMNEVKSEYTGTINQIFVQNGQNIEYGQPVMSVL